MGEVNGRWGWGKLTPKTVALTPEPQENVPLETLQDPFEDERVNPEPKIEISDLQSRRAGKMEEKKSYLKLLRCTWRKILLNTTFLH